MTSLLALVRARRKETMLKVVCNASGLDWEQVNVSNKCSEISRITYSRTRLWTHCGAEGQTVRPYSHVTFVPPTVSPACTKYVEGAFVAVVFASFKYFSCFQYQKEKKKKKKQML